MLVLATRAVAPAMRDGRAVVVATLGPAASQAEPARSWDTVEDAPPELGCDAPEPLSLAPLSGRWQQTEGIDVTVRIAGDANPEMDIRTVDLRRSARADRADRITSRPPSRP